MYTLPVSTMRLFGRSYMQLNLLDRVYTHRCRARVDIGTCVYSEYDARVQNSIWPLETYFLGAFPTPLPPAISSSSSDGTRFSFSGGVVDGEPKNSPIPFCHFGVGLTQTGLPPAYLLSASHLSKSRKKMSKYMKEDYCITVVNSLQL